MSLVYFDNSVIKALMNSPHFWDNFYDDLVQELGENIKPIQSYYLFFEYFDFHKRNFDKPNEEELNKIKNFNEAQIPKQTGKLGLMLSAYFNQACNTVLNKLYSREIRISLFKHTQQAKKYESEFEANDSLKNILFGELLLLIHQDYQTFAERAAMFLAWDYFCGISANRIVREAQLGIWLQLLEKRALLPFGKIIDDLPEYCQISFSRNTAFKESEDMVDSEALMFLLIGNIAESGTIDPVNIVTIDPIINIQERVEMGSNALFRLEENKKIKINKCRGKAYCLSRDDLKLKNVV